MNGRKRALLLLAEECGEVSKEAVRQALGKNKTRTRLSKEAAQVVALAHLLIAHEVINCPVFEQEYHSQMKRYKEIING